MEGKQRSLNLSLSSIHHSSFITHHFLPLTPSDVGTPMKSTAFVGLVLLCAGPASGAGRYHKVSYPASESPASCNSA